MGNVIEFNSKNEKHMTGEAFCACCKHEWIAVAPVGTTMLECPGCKTANGLFKYPTIPMVDRWQCNCGNDLFYITETGTQCYRCGQEQTF